MKYAVIQTGGKQYRVSEGDTISIEKLANTKVGSKISFDKVLLVEDGHTTQIGTPYLKGAEVSGELVSQDKTKKVLGMKYKAKSNYRVKFGHRQTMLKVKILAIK